MSDSTERLVLKYFHSWQEPPDYEALRETLASDVEFDAGGQVLKGADRLTAMVRETESPWEQVTLLASIFEDEAAALFYEGVDSRSKIKTRVAEHLAIRNGRIGRILAAICPLG